jgi:hypothetical protein
MRRNKIVKVSLSEQEYEKLVAAATYKGVSPSEFLRDVVKSLSVIHERAQAQIVGALEPLPDAPLTGERGDSQGKRAKTEPWEIPPTLLFKGRVDLLTRENCESLISLFYLRQALSQANENNGI